MIKDSTLTDREQQVLRLIAEGLTTKEIASLLGRSAETISNHRKHICYKLNIHSTAGLVAAWYRKPGPIYPTVSPRDETS